MSGSFNSSTGAWLVGFNVRTRLLLLSGVSLVLFATALLVAVFAMHSSQTRFHNFIDSDTARLAAFNGMYAQGLQSGQALRNIMLDPANRKAYDNLDKALADFGAAIVQAKKSSTGRADILTIIDKVEG